MARFLPSVAAPARRRTVCLAVTSDIGTNQGRPSSCSAKVDQLCFDNRTVSRLLLISAGIWGSVSLRLSGTRSGEFVKPLRSNRKAARSHAQASVARFGQTARISFSVGQGLQNLESEWINSN
jgi:hypothetical protein